MTETRHYHYYSKLFIGIPPLDSKRGDERRDIIIKGTTQTLFTLMTFLLKPFLTEGNN